MLANGEFEGGERLPDDDPFGKSVRTTATLFEQLEEGNVDDDDADKIRDKYKDVIDYYPEADSTTDESTEEDSNKRAKMKQRVANANLMGMELPGEKKGLEQLAMFFTQKVADGSIAEEDGGEEEDAKRTAKFVADKLPSVTEQKQSELDGSGDETDGNGPEDPEQGV